MAKPLIPWLQDSSNSSPNMSELEWTLVDVTKKLKVDTINTSIIKAFGLILVNGVNRPILDINIVGGSILSITYVSVELNIVKSNAGAVPKVPKWCFEILIPY